MRKTALLFILALCSNVFAQTITTGPIYEGKSKAFDPTILGEDKENFYIAEYHDNLYTIEAYDKIGFEKVYSQPLYIPETLKSKFKFHSIYYHNGNFTTFASYYDRKSKSTQLFSYTFNRKDGQPIGERLNLLTIDGELLGRLSYEQSKDKSRILVGHEAYSYKMNRTTIRYRLLDGNSEIILSKDIELDGYDREMSTAGVILDNDGSIYSISYNDTHYRLIILDADKDYENWTEQVEIEGLDVGESLRGGSMKIDNEGNVICVGYYGNEKDKLQGFTYLKIDPYTKEITDYNSEPFSESLIDQFLIEELGYGEEQGVPDKFDNQIEILKTGGFILISEQVNYKRKLGYFGINSAQYSFGDILVSKFNDDGEVQWSTKIPREQEFKYNKQLFGITYASPIGAKGDPPLYLLKHYSYSPLVADRYISLVFLDDKENIEKNHDDDRYILENPYEGNPVITSIDLAEGVMSQKVIERNPEEELTFVPRSSKQSKIDGELLFMRSHKKSYQFGRIHLDEVPAQEEEDDKQTASDE